MYLKNYNIKMKNYFLDKIKRIKINLIDLIVILHYCLFFVLLVLSLLGLFNKYLVGGILFVILFSILVFYRQIKFSKNHLYFFIFIPLLFIGFFLFKGFFTGDATSYWLPWSREIVLQGKMPDFLLNIPSFINGRMPFFPLLLACVFLFLPFKEIFVIAIPLFFTTATALLLYQWARDKGINKRYLFFIVLLFLINPITIKYGWDLFQESLVLFFFTAFFYYLEKYQQSNNIFYFYLISFSFILAIASKFTGLFLVLPLFLMIIKNKTFRKYCWSHLIFICLPIIFWFTRNYIIYDNPVSPFLNGLFRGRYYELIEVVNVSVLQHFLSFFDSISVKLSFIFKNFLFAFPFIFLSFYGFWKKKKNQYIFLVLLFFLLINLFPTSPFSAMRHSYPILGLLLIYALVGLKYVKSRLFISFVFFFAFLGLLGTEIYSSKSYFIVFFEKSLNIFYIFSQFIYEYRLFVALILSLFFYFFLSNRKYWQYLILLIFSSYLVKTSTIQVSWLNIWLPILFLLSVVLIWAYLDRLKELFLRRLIISYIIVLLILNTFGLASMFFINHKQFIFPKMEVYGILPEVANQIKELENDNKNFYIYVAFPHYLSWYHNYKIVNMGDPTFYYIINNLQYNNNLTTQEIHSIFKKSNIRYIIENAHRPFWHDFFDKIKQEPDLFELLFEKQEHFLWRVI